MGRLLDNFKLKTGLFMPDDEPPDDFEPAPADLNLIEADEIVPPDVGDALSDVPPPPLLPPDVPRDEL